jgi:AGZA family xanthine/uracil permease-like MFS transporter
MAQDLTKPKLWVLGDLNGFFGLFTNVLLNTIVLTSLSLFVVKIPEATVYGRILPALGVALMLGNIFYAYLAYQKAKREKRDTVAALPYGPSVPHMFIVVFVVMLPTYLTTGNPVTAWVLGLVWALIIGLIVMAGALVGPIIRKYTPKAAMLGTLAGISITFISMAPAFQMFDTAWIGLICFMIILVSWMGNVRLPFGIPGGLAVVIVGGVLAWGAVLLGLPVFSGYMHPAAVGESFKQFGFRLPMFSFDVFSLSMDQVWPLLVTAIPLGIYNFTEAMNNVESAATAGDEYNLRAVLLADGSGAVLGAFAGSPFPPAVYIGHPGWKAIGGRIGYSLATGIAIGLVCMLGLTALLLSVIPLVAILPILLFIGLVIGSQAFQATPRRHAPAIILALVPNIADWLHTQIDNVVSVATGKGVSPELAASLASGAAVYYTGIATTGGGGILAGLVLGAIGVFVIEKRFNWAAVYAGIATVLSFFGFIHGSHLAVNTSPTVTFGYLLATLAFLYFMFEEKKGGNAISWKPVSESAEE